MKRYSSFYRTLFLLVCISICLTLWGCGAKPAAKFSDPFTQARNGQWIEYEKYKVRFVSGYSKDEIETASADIMSYSDEFVFQRENIIIAQVTFGTARCVELTYSSTGKTLGENPVYTTTEFTGYFTGYEAVVGSIFYNTSGVDLYEGEPVRLMSIDSIKRYSGYHIPQEGDQYYLMMIDNQNLPRDFEYYDFYQMLGDFTIAYGHSFLWPILEERHSGSTQRDDRYGRNLRPGYGTSVSVPKASQEDFESLLNEKIESYCPKPVESKVPKESSSPIPEGSTP